MKQRAVGVVGKLPGWADFVRLGVRGAAFEQLLRWLVAGSELAAASRGGQFASLGEGSVQAFVYRYGRSLLCGALAPSCDSVGRRVPVAAAVEIEADEAIGRHPELVPVLFEDVWAQTAELVSELQQSAREEMSDRSWSLELSLALSDAAETYGGWA